MNATTADRLRQRARDWLASPSAQEATILTAAFLRSALRDADRAATAHATASLGLASRSARTRWDLARAVARTHAALRLHLSRALSGYQYPPEEERRAEQWAAQLREGLRDALDSQNRPRRTTGRHDA